MLTTHNARQAFDKLQARGVTAMEWDDDPDSVVQFIVPHASRDGAEKFADIDQRWIQEAYINGHLINPMGVRHDIHEVLAEHNLATEWEDAGTLCVYDADTHDVGGWSHKDCSERHPHSEEATAEKQNGRKNQFVNWKMSQAAFRSFRELARLGAPVEGLFKHLNDIMRHPLNLKPGTQFLMHCEPEAHIFFADPPDALGQHFPDTKGLRPDVYSAASRNGLTHDIFEHQRPDPWGPTSYVAFFDPNSELGTGVVN